MIIFNRDITINLKEFWPEKDGKYFGLDVVPIEVEAAVAEGQAGAFACPVKDVERLHPDPTGAGPRWQVMIG